MLFKKRQPDRSRRMPRPAAADGFGAQPVFSYHARSARTEPASVRQTNKLPWAAPSKRAPERRSPSRWRKRALTVSAAALVVVLVANSLLLSSQPLVVAIADTAGRQSLLGSLDTYQRVASGILSGSLLSTNKLTIDTSRVATAIKEQFPELEQVSVTFPVVGRQPVIYVQPAQPALLFKTADNSVFVLDQTGRAVMTASRVRKLDRLGLVTAEDQSGLAAGLGQTMLPSDQVAFITEVIDQLRAKEIKIAGMILPRGASEVDLRLQGVSYIVKFNLRGNARAEAGAFLAVKQHLEREGKTARSYIDVRVDNKAYYR